MKRQNSSQMKNTLQNFNTNLRIGKVCPIWDSSKSPSLSSPQKITVNHTKTLRLPQLYSGCLKENWVLSSSLEAARTCSPLTFLQSVNKMQKSLMYWFLTVGWEHLMAEKHWVMWQGKDWMLHQLQFAQAGLQMYVTEGKNTSNKAPAAQILTSTSTSSTVPEEWVCRIEIHAEDLTSALHMKFSLCFRLALVWSPQLIPWPLGTRISKLGCFLLSSLRNPFHMLCNANNSTVTGDSWETCLHGTLWFKLKC